MELITELDKNYLQIEDRTEESDNYKKGMLINNNIDELIKVKEIYIGNVLFLRYEITDMKSVVREYDSKSMSYKQMSEIILNVINVCEGIKKYLLSTNNLVINPELMYLDCNSEKMKLLYIPFECEDNKNRFSRLAEFFLEKADYEDNQAVNLAYLFYKMSKEEFFSIENFKKNLLNQENYKCVEVSTEEENISYEENNFSDRKDITFKEYKNEKDLNKPVIIFTILLGIIALCISVLIKKITKNYIYLFYFGFLLFTISIFVVTRHIITNIKAKEEKDIFENLYNATGKVEDYWEDEGKTCFFDVKSNNDYELRWMEQGIEKRIVINHFPFIVGSKKEFVDGCIEEMSISRKHAKIIFKENNLKICDLSSTNGTFINSRRIMPGEEVIIDRNDEIQFGKLVVNVV